MANQVRAIADSDKVVVETIPGFESIPRSQRCRDLAVLVRVAAPPERTTRAGVDLVAALDISGSMRGERLKSMQQAMLFVIDQLGADDRLSIVAFSHEVKPLTKLCAMSDGRHREEAKNAINQLVADGGNDMVGALETAAKILKQQGESNRASRILFLSDGEDPSVFHHRINPDSPVPVETFGLSAGHNPNVMRYIADQTSGVYSFVNQDLDKITNAFAQSMGGLKSVVAMGVQISLKAQQEGVTISSIQPADGRYRPSISPDGRSGSMYIHDLYAGEHKNFIVYLTVPEGGVKELLSVGGTYKDPSAAESSPVEIKGSKAAVPRPWFGTPWRWRREPERDSAAAAVRPEVAAELVRQRLVKAVSDMAQAQQPAAGGDGRLQILWDEIRSSDDGRRAPAEDMSALNEDVALMQDQREGVPFMLSWLTSHLSQRATFKGSASGAGVFQTPAMVGMIRIADPEAVVEEQKPVVYRRHEPVPVVIGIFGKAKNTCADVITRARANPCSCVLPFAALLLLLAVFVPLRGPVVVVIDNNNEQRQQEDGNNGTTVNSASIVLELSQHQGWLKVEKSLEAIVLSKMEDAGITAASLFHGASAEVMSQATNRYLLLALVHATMLGSRCASVPSAEAEGIISLLEQKVEMLEADKMELGAKMELLVKETEEAATNRAAAAAAAACKDNDEALERASTRIAELERQLQDKKAFADSLLAEVANADAHLKTCGQRVDMLEAKLRESELEGPVVEA